MLYPNGQRVLCYPGRHMAGSLAASGAMAYGGLRGARLNRYVSGTYSKVLGAVPSGYSGKSYVFAVKSGGLTAFSGLTVTPAATGVLGLPGTGSADFAFTVADLIGQLISSGSGTAAMSINVANLVLTGSVSGAGSSLFSLTSNTPILGALAGAYATATMTFNGTLSPYAIGSMTGNTVSGGVLTEASIIAAMNANPPGVNIKKVNDVTVNGTGATGNEWGP